MCKCVRMCVSVCVLYVRKFVFMCICVIVFICTCVIVYTQVVADVASLVGLFSHLWIAPLSFGHYWQ